MNPKASVLLAPFGKPATPTDTRISFSVCASYSNTWDCSVRFPMMAAWLSKTRNLPSGVACTACSFCPAQSDSASLLLSVVDKDRPTRRVVRIALEHVQVVSAFVGRIIFGVRPRESFRRYKIYVRPVLGHACDTKHSRVLQFISRCTARNPNDLFPAIQIVEIVLVKILFFVAGKQFLFCCKEYLRSIFRGSLENRPLWFTNQTPATCFGRWLRDAHRLRVPQSRIQLVNRWSSFVLAPTFFVAQRRKEHRFPVSRYGVVCVAGFESTGSPERGPAVADQVTRGIHADKPWLRVTHAFVFIQRLIRRSRFSRIAWPKPFWLQD